MAEENHERGDGGREGSGIEHRDSAQRSADATGLDDGSDGDAQRAAWKKLIVEEVEGLMKRFEKEGPQFTIEHMNKNPVVGSPLDKMIVESLDRLLAEKVKSPLAAMAVWIAFSETGKESNAAKLVAYRVCCTAALLGQYRWLKRMSDEGKDLGSRMKSPRTLFEARNGLEHEATWFDKFELVRKHLTMRGILKQKQKSKRSQT